MKIRKDDNVLVISWKDKWKQWKVLKVLTKTEKVIVEWVNIITRNYKKTWAMPGQSIQKEAPIHISNVMLICPFTKKPTRVWFVFVKDKSWVKKFRFSKAWLKLKWGKPEDYIIK